jgi:hypothetical protein
MVSHYEFFYLIMSLSSTHGRTFTLSFYFCQQGSTWGLDNTNLNILLTQLLMLSVWLCLATSHTVIQSIMLLMIKSLLISVSFPFTMHMQLHHWLLFHTKHCAVFDDPTDIIECKCTKANNLVLGQGCLRLSCCTRMASKWKCWKQENGLEDERTLWK